MVEFFKDEKGEEVQITLDGEDIPESFRGKDMKAVLGEADAKLKGVTEMEAKIKASEAKIKDLEAKTTPAPTEPVKKTPEEITREIHEKFEADPRGLMLGLVDERLGPLVQQQTEINVDTQIEAMKKEHPGFEKYEKDVREKLKTVSPEVRANKEVIDAFYKMASYNDLATFKTKVESGEIKPESIEGPPGHLPPSGPAPRQPKPEPLSVDEKKQMSIWGFKDEKEFREWQSEDASEGAPIAREREEREKAAQRTAQLRR